MSFTMASYGRGTALCQLILFVIFLGNTRYGFAFPCARFHLTLDDFKLDVGLDCSVPGEKEQQEEEEEEEESTLLSTCISGEKSVQS